MKSQKFISVAAIFGIVCAAIISTGAFARPGAGAGGAGGPGAGGAGRPGAGAGGAGRPGVGAGGVHHHHHAHRHPVARGAAVGVAVGTAAVIATPRRCVQSLDIYGHPYTHCY